MVIAVHLKQADRMVHTLYLMLFFVFLFFCFFQKRIYFSQTFERNFKLAGENGEKTEFRRATVKLYIYMCVFL